MYRSFTPRRIIPGIKLYERTPLLLTDEQKQLLHAMLSLHQSLWADAIAYEKNKYETTGTHTSYVGLSRWFTQYRREHTEYKAITLLSGEATLRRLSSHMSGFYKRSKRFHKVTDSISSFSYRVDCSVIGNTLLVKNLGIFTFVPVEFIGLLKDVAFFFENDQWDVLFTMKVPPADYEILPADRKHAIPVYSAGGV